MALDFPNSPTIGDEFTGGGFTWVWTGTTWSKVAAATGSGSGFNLLVGSSGNTTYTFTDPQPAGSYVISSLTESDTTFDIYFINSADQEVGYTNTLAIEASEEFTKVVLYGAVSNDIFSFEFKPAASPTTSGEFSGGVGPFLTSATPSALPNIDDTTTITGGNFANDVAITFIGQDLTALPAKNIVRTSSTSLIVTRPDAFAIAQSPYTVRALNPGTDEPIGSNANRLSNAVTAGTNPAWITGSNVYFVPGEEALITLLATDTEGSDIDYTIVTGTLPTGLSLNSETGVISGTNSDAEGTTTTVTFRATDAGGNFVDKAISLVANNRPVWTTPTGALDNATNGFSYSYQLVASSGGAGGNLSFAIQSGSLPTGFTLSSSGLISGTSTIDGNNTFTVRVSDEANFFTDREFSILVISSFDLEYLVVAGGGGGGTLLTGGGAGGYRTATDFSADRNVNYTVTVGAGGATSTSYPSRGGSGTNSIFGPISATGGGGGAGEGPQQFSPIAGMNGSPGGSGGGGSQYAGVGGAGNAGGYTPVEGYAGGGVSGYLQAYGGGGGGGAGGVGAPGTGASGGNGGIGAISTIITSALATSLSIGEVSNGNVYFAGGGAGVQGNVGADGIGGLGGGGDKHQAGAARTGGAGGGKRADQDANANVAGGSGVVVLKYPAVLNINVGAGLTSSTTTVNSEKVTVFTAGTGTITFS